GWPPPKNGVIPDRFGRCRPLRLTATASIFDDNAHTALTVIILWRAQNPNARIFHFDNRIDAFGSSELQNIDGFWCRHRIAVERHDKKAMTRQRELNVFGRASIEHMKHDPLALADTNRLTVA